MFCSVLFSCRINDAIFTYTSKYQIPSLHDAFVPIQDQSKGLEQNRFVPLNTWIEPVPIQSGPPQQLGPGPGPIQVLFRYWCGKFSV